MLARRLLNQAAKAKGRDLFQQRVLDVLGSSQPCIAVSANNVSVIRQPEKFYSSLLDMIRRARRRLFLSSLYIGPDEHGLFSAMEDALDRNPDLTLHLQLDFNRSTRPGADSPILRLVELLRKHPERVDIRLFRSPKLRGLMRRIVPRRFDEGWGTWHVKCYGSDDDVILSGANLNKSYFTNRQDRYLHFVQQPDLTGYCHDFLKLMARFSYKLELGDGADYQLVWSHSETSENSFIELGQTAIGEFQKAKTIHHTLDQKADTVVFPFIQSMQFGIREEEGVMMALLSFLKEALNEKPATRPLLHMTTGYFSLHDDYQHFLIDCGVDCRVLISSPEANGFFGSAGLSGLLPDAYSLLAKDFWRRVRKQKRDWVDNPNGIRIDEWWKRDWTYHAKGLWIAPTHSSAPYLTMFGSSNLNSRSVHLDTELGFVMHTSSEKLQKQLQDEVQGLFQPSTAVTSKTWLGDSHRIRLLARILVRLWVKDML